MQGLQKLEARFFRTDAGREPVREWLRSLPVEDRKTIGDDIRTVQFGWPIGMPLVEKLDARLWEVRTRLGGRISRVIFAILDGEMILLHGFIKKTRRISKTDIETAKARLKALPAR